MKRMRLRYAGLCGECGLQLISGSPALYDPATKKVFCGEHGLDPDQPLAPEGAVRAEPADTDPGDPGASARREYDRRRKSREDRIRTKHPKVGGLILALSEDPQSTKAWGTGATGEERLGARLNELSSETLRLLHDRHIPGTRANIDHIAITPAGVWVIDAKKYKGRPELRVEGGLIRPRSERLIVGGRDQTKLVAGMHKQVRVVTGIVGDDIQVQAVLCFVEADWPLIGGAFATQDVQVIWPKKLYSQLVEAGPLDLAAIRALHAQLGQALPPA